MNQVFKMILICTLITYGVTHTADAQEATAGKSAATENQGGIIRGTLMYLPNRLFDLQDMVRARVRVGPGTTASVRATKLVNASVGSHMTVYAGLPGPRNKPSVNLPVGLDNYTGIEASVVNLSNNNNAPFSPTYGTTEFGAGFQALLLGLDLGVDPLEVVDFAFGLLLIDIKGDDF